MIYILGLGNPDDEYMGTRHNVGRMVLDFFAKKNDFSEWKEDISSKSLISKGEIGKNKVTFIKPETFMNKSGISAKYFVDSEKKALKLVVIHDDLDLPIGRFKISFNKSSGGHRGVESIIKAIKTEAFIRIRVGISPSTPSGKLKKPHGEEAVGDFILGKFKKSEEEILSKNLKLISEAISMLVNEGREKAMGEFNSM